MKEIAKDIIEVAAGGDMAAFEKIYKEFSSGVHALAFGITRNREDAEEVTQDVFIKVFGGLKYFRFGSSFGTWLYRITMNTAINLYHKRARRGAEVVRYDKIEDVRQATDDMSEREAGRRDAAARLAEILKNIKPDHRSCLVLREIEGLDYKEIAGILGIPLNTVRSRLKRARESLIEYCRKEGMCHEV